MGVAFTAGQKAWIRRRSRPADAQPSDSGELNIVPFLDIITNVLMFMLATIATIFTAAIPIPLPGTGGDQPGVSPLVLKVDTGGFILGDSHGFLRSDCASFGAGGNYTVPAKAGRLDFAELNRCLQTLRDHVPGIAALSKLVISMTGTLPYNTMVRTLDATRETAPGKSDMFTAPAFGVVTISSH